jgi:predicted PurR-regulated permease PerM
VFFEPDWRSGKAIPTRISNANGELMGLAGLYMLEPFIDFLESKKIPRWATALTLVLFASGIVTTVAIFVFPVLFSQLDSAIKQISSIVTSVSSFVESRKFYKLFEGFGISSDTIKNIVQTEFVPEIKTFISKILESLLSFLTSLSGVASQLINGLLLPIFSFYFLKDFNKIKDLIKSLLERKNVKFLNDLKRINRIFRIYISWQITAAIIIGTSCSILFSIFGIPYPIVLGLICGFLNPIPYMGSLASMVICILTSALVNPDEFLYLSLTSISIITALHFINAYLLEPNIAGKQVGLHPLLLILSLFVFGTLFGFIGLMVAVPTTASLIMFFNDWRNRQSAKTLEISLSTQPTE